MTQKFTSIVLILSLLTLLLNSCKCACTCSDDMGCTLLEVRLISNDSLLAKKTICSITDYYSDKIRENSVLTYMSAHKTDSTYISYKDSIYKYESVKNLTCDQINDYKSKGYGCHCAK